MNESYTGKPWRGRAHQGGNARETAYQILRDGIIYLDFKPGEALSDKQLAEQLSMSRTPVREALILLASANMVVLRPQVGTFVAPIDVQRMEMEQFARCAVEKEIVRLCCEKPDADLRWRYEENLRAFAHYAAQEQPDLRRLLELDNDFHRIAFSAVGREDNYLHMMEGLQHVERMRVLSNLGMAQEETLEDHRAISSAIMAGDSAAALRQLEIHLNRYRDNLRLLEGKFPEYFSMG